MELRGEITRIDEEGGKVTIDLGTLVTVDMDKVRLIEKYRPPKRKRPCVTWWTSVQDHETVRAWAALKLVRMAIEETCPAGILPSGEADRQAVFHQMR